MSSKDFIVCIRLRPRINSDSLQSSIEVDYKSGEIKTANSVYYFEKVYDPNISNQILYKELVSPKITDFLSGKNVTVLAYGATGSGKTFTIGTDKSLSDGLLQRSLHEIFELINEDFKVKVSFIEIYNEKVYDLLNSGKPLDRLKDTKDGFEVDGLTEFSVTDKKSAISVLMKGCMTRKTSKTTRNSHSSRSHAIYTITAEKFSHGYIQRSKFSIADLAGSERYDNKNELQQKEGIYINLSLSQLTTVISQLASRLKTPAYRDSKLTSILKDSLGGNAVTVLIACLNPHTPVNEEIRATLHFAFKAKKIINTAKENLYKDTSINYEIRFKKLQQENEDLKSKLLVYESNILASKQTKSEVLCSPESPVKETVDDTIQKNQPSKTNPKKAIETSEPGPSRKQGKISKDDSMLGAYFESSSDSEKETNEEAATYPRRLVYKLGCLCTTDCQNSLCTCYIRNLPCHTLCKCVKINCRNQKPLKRKIIDLSD